MNPIVLRKRDTYLEQQLADWTVWFRENSTRVSLFYANAGGDIRVARATFLHTMMRGYLMMITEILATVRDLWQTREQPMMPVALKSKIDEDIRWYNMHKDVVRDPDKQWLFLLTMSGKLLVTCHRLVEELGRIQQATVLATVDGKDRVVVFAEELACDLRGEHD